MKTYELTFLIDAQIPPEKQEEVTAKYLELLNSLGAEILNVEKWGKKKLAFIIEDRQYGNYVMTQFRVQATAIAQIEHHLRLSPHIFRHLILLRDPRTLKKIRLEQERLAKEALLNVEKERIQVFEKVEEIAEGIKISLDSEIIEDPIDLDAPVDNKESLENGIIDEPIDLAKPEGDKE
jgi:small subunit ribosomal protein S6